MSLYHVKCKKWGKGYMKKIISICVMILCLVGCTNSTPKDTIRKLEKDGFQINLLDESEPPRVSVMKNRNDPWIVFYFNNDKLEYIQYAQESKGVSELDYVVFYNGKDDINKDANKAYQDFLKANNYSQGEMEDFAEYIYNRDFEN